MVTPDTRAQHTRRQHRRIERHAANLEPLLTAAERLHLRALCNATRDHLIPPHIALHIITAQISKTRRRP